MKNKRGMELAMSIIVIAAIAILILVIIGVLFTGQASDFDEKIRLGCVPNGGLCMDEDTCEEKMEAAGWVEVDEIICPKEKVCCMSKLASDNLYSE